MASMIQILLNNLFLVGVMVLSTLGITLTFKTANVANFAQGILATVGAFVAAFFFMRMGVDPWISLVGGVVVCFIIGYTIDVLIMSFMSSSGAVGRVMVTLGLILIISAFIPIIFGMIPYNFPRFFAGNFTWEMMGSTFIITRNGLFTFVTSMSITAIIFIALYKTKWGLMVRATASNATVAAMLGINTKRMTALSWGISSACASLAAVFLGAQTTNVHADMMAVIATISLLALVMGGFTSFFGPVIGAIIIPTATAMLAMISGLWANVLLYTFVLLTILIKPMGIFGKKTMEKV
ncbi:MAG: branched-chain amino acid ABC transporter permease [Defluviitaleaceae bacterium]|nr:branched-chain amino acid ABC transporter permease [Defluviitaleaceae bacterium]